MIKKFTNVDTYAATPDQLWTMLSDQSYWEAKYEALGATNLDWHTFNVDSNELTVSSIREVHANLPAAVRKIVGESAHVAQTEHWSKAGDELSCQISIATKGAPGGTTGIMTIVPADGGSSWAADFDIHVPIPLLGKKLEQIMFDETAKDFVAERVFNNQWLTQH